MNFNGLTALVTGASRGIGLSIAESLSKSGCKVYGTSTSGKEVSEHFEMLTFDAKKNNYSAFSDLFSSNKIDIIVNNAGINIIETIEELNLDSWDDVLNINLSAPLKIIKNLLPFMNKGGKIVNISSIWGVISKSGRCSYTAAKTGLIGLTRTLALDLAKNDILVNAVCPGFTLTELTKNSLNDEEMSKLTSEIPLGRMAETEEIANLVSFLCSPNNTYITGQAITIDGGFTIR